METRYHALVAGSRDLLTRLDSAVQCCGVYDEMTGEVGRALTDVESAVVQQSAASAAVPDNDVDVQRQLDLVTTTAQRVAALGKVKTIMICLHYYYYYYYYYCVVRRMNEVALRWARLVLGWVTVFRRVYHPGM